MLEHRVDRHDRSQVELKLHYGIEPQARQQNYQVEAFIFVPRSLAFTRESYTPERFYGDTVRFIRMTTPRVALSSLADESYNPQWLSALNKHTKLFLDGKHGDASEIIWGLKLAGCITEGALSAESTDLHERLRQVARADGAHGSEGAASHAARWLDAFQEAVSNALERIRKLGALCENQLLPAEVRSSWLALDEYLSWTAEEALTRTVALVQNEMAHLENDELQTARNQLADAAVTEYRHRRGRGYQSYVTEGERNEFIPHRQHVLKRFVHSVLYLDVQKRQTGAILQSVIGMVAAAMAMLFATIAIVLINQQWGSGFSTAFVTAMVGSYIIKDRIKEHGKRILGRKLAAGLANHVLHVTSQDSDDVLGQVSESFQVVDATRVDDEVRELRHADHPELDSVDGRPETVLYYRKDVRLANRQLLDHLASTQGLTDIIRLNFQRLMTRMDDPWWPYQYIDPDNGELKEVPCARVYHVNILLRLNRGDGSSSLEHVRVVLNRKGIKRVGDEQHE